jgi:NAD-dependent SIR2 family protein deacetylase
LPDFRGPEGFWRAYPAAGRLGLHFEELANPRWFERDPALAWGFYGHRLLLYRQTTPHDGFGVLLRLAARMPRGHFVFTSNIDGQFQRAGFDAGRVVECHGSIHHLQCAAGCGVGIFAADSFAPDVDLEELRAHAPLPRCRRCGALARPNVLMFFDRRWDAARTHAQEGRLSRWLGDLPARARVVVIECGAGGTIPTVRRTSEAAAARNGATLVRINVRESEVSRGHLGLALGAREALVGIEDAIAMMARA